MPELSSLYAMQRANGDWYALDDHGGFRVPVFRSNREAMVARSRDSGMECFRPVIIDSRAFHNLTTTDGGKAFFWFVENPAINLNRGRRFDHAQLAALIRTREEQARG